MEEDLIKARSHLIQTKRLLQPHFSKTYWSSVYEDIDRLIQDISQCLEAIRKGEPLPP